eukprot:TRINITY_DN8562_c0_g2_i1.p1 TRINITY_DN8562_c0_g2~~TRINITY_DN8562_c0_g2_i1.p1  ORF type:complete len:363 (-),score=95.53 TRINITY_DN8562_c0_g2_i1:457-1545(-)
MAAATASLHRQVRWRQLAALCAAYAFGAEGMCPKGFGGDGLFPAEWQIPKWPTDMSLEEAADLRTVTLGGFKIKNLNEEYLEGPTDDFVMQGRETYWQASGEYFLYYCRRFDKWRIAAISAFGRNMDGQCFAFVSDSYRGRDITNKSLIKDWIEVEDGNWVRRESAGVVELGRLGDQMEGLSGGDDEECSAEGASEEGEESSPFGQPKKKKSNCPVMPVVRKAKDKVVEVAKAAGKWVQRLFPKYLGEPSKEDEIPEEPEEDVAARSEDADETSAAGVPRSSNCNFDTLDECSFKEKYYITKQRNATAAGRREELERLGRMMNVAMKEDKRDWLRSRYGMLQALVANDEKAASAPNTASEEL